MGIRETGRPTLETVAARAGVSKSLVSLVLRDSPKVSPARRAAVLAAIAELGYRPNAAARRLAERRSHSVGVLLNDLHQPWFADVLDGVGPVLHAEGKHMLLGDGRLDRMMDDTLTWSFLELGVDGLLVAGSGPPSAALVDVAHRLPTVAVGGRDLDMYGELPSVDVVAYDDHAGAALAVGHLADLGHRTIAHLAGPPGSAGRDRTEGYEEAMRAAGLGGAIRVVRSDVSEESARHAALGLLRGPDRPTAVFAYNDMVAMGVSSAAVELGLRVPEDLSLVGFDNSGLARLRAIWLTSVDGAGERIGAQAARMLVTRMAEPERAREVRLVAPALEVRGSTAPPG
ncbi:LacI family DNA-binding transcriptional regulator [Pseudonocardia yuanmonensis]|uniref:LacI family DNA-binding transcriptional regulator n=1 Tax=Pseudonocardia yuanmonensis TaxID=1095914 RepID=A0ABP8W1Z7_9PSEU